MREAMAPQTAWTCTLTSPQSKNRIAFRESGRLRRMVSAMRSSPNRNNALLSEGFVVEESALIGERVMSLVQATPGLALADYAVSVTRPSNRF